MNQVAKIFINDRSQAVRLPASFRFDVKEVFVRKDPDAGDVILSRKPADWDGFLSLLKSAAVPANFLDEVECNPGTQTRDPFAGRHE